MSGPVAAAAIYALAGSCVAAAAGCIVLRLLRRFRIGQHAYEDAPQSHRRKSGTPTMGGIVFALSSLLLLIPHDVLSTWMLILILACAAIGLLDDYLGVAHGRNAGLRARTKLLATALVAVVFLREISESTAIFPRDTLLQTSTFALVVPHWLWLILGILAVTGTIHAVNLTDGLDGLAAGSMIPPLLAFLAIGVLFFVPAAVTAAAIGAGACAAFLAFNYHPAKMFMGDTGSLALGAWLSGIAILTGEMLLLLPIGGVFVAEALSVILQVLYYKATKRATAHGTLEGKRIFRMTPLHHHFELGGWPETKVTARFWLASLLCSLLGWIIVR